MRRIRNLRPLLAALALLAGAALAHAEYATPGLGVDWTMDDLVAASGGAVTGSSGTYEVHESVVVSLGDRLTIAPGSTLIFQDTTGQIGLEANGSLIADGTAAAPIVFRPAVETPGAWRGLDFNDGGASSDWLLDHCEIGWADEAVDIFDAPVWLENTHIHHSASKALDISSASPTVIACTFTDNVERTITITLSSSPDITDCYFENNNTANSSPYPYINIGLQGVNSPWIARNTIIGSGNFRSGGISVWASSNARIEDNEIRDCGYGILCYSTGANPLIIGNVIEDNTTNPDTVNWGFGVACNGSNAPILMNNQIRGHWYGVAAINGGQPNLGDLINDFPGDDGGNVIENNGLGGEVYGFYNNTPLPQMAQGNWWGTADAQGVEDAIFHQPDQASLGLVTYDPWLQTVGAPTTPAAAILQDAGAHPNPFNPQVTVRFTLTRAIPVMVAIHDVAGRAVRDLHAGALGAGTHELRWDGTDRGGRALSSGTYFYRIVAGGEVRTGKLTLVR
jgi:parallel beta-helix repeat protein